MEPGERTRDPVPRRTVIRGTAAAVGLGTVGGIGLWYGSGPALAAAIEEDNWSAEDAGITTHDGSITAVDIRPTVGVEWEGFDGTPTELGIEIAVDFPEAEEDDGGGLIGGIIGILVPDADDLPHTMYDQTKTLEGTTGEETFTLDEKNLTAEAEIEGEGFEAADGGTNETVVELLLTVDADREGVDEETASTTFTVTVENLAASMDMTGGTVETGVESDEAVED